MIQVDRPRADEWLNEANSLIEETREQREQGEIDAESSDALISFIEEAKADLLHDDDFADFLRHDHEFWRTLVEEYFAYCFGAYPHEFGFGPEDVGVLI